MTARNPGGLDDLRYTWRRFSEWVGDMTCNQVTPAMAEEFVNALRSMPKTRVPAVVAKPVRTILAEHSSDVTLSPKTNCKTASEVNRVFEYAAELEIVRRNPMQHAKPKKPGKEDQAKARLAYTKEGIADLFGRPMFKGFSGRVDHRGYRAQPGAQIVKDAKFWLPIFALWHGCRLEEIGGALTSEFVDGDVPLLDWRETKRAMKTDENYRAQPVHQSFSALGSWTTAASA